MSKERRQKKKWQRQAKKILSTMGSRVQAHYGQAISCARDAEYGASTFWGHYMKTWELVEGDEARKLMRGRGIGPEQLASVVVDAIPQWAYTMLPEGIAGIVVRRCRYDGPCFHGKGKTHEWVVGYFDRRRVGDFIP